EHPAARYSYLAAKPEAMIKAYGRKIEIWKNGQKIRCYQANPWQALRDFRAEWNDWMIGYLGYDLKNNIELLESHNRDDVEAPDLFFMIPAALLKADHKTGLVETVKGHMPEAQSLSEVSKRGYVEGLKPTITQNTYISRVEQIQQHIAE